MNMPDKQNVASHQAPVCREEKETDSAPPALSEAVDIEGQALDAEAIGKIIESEQRGSLPGRMCGVILVVAGLGLMASGLSGSVSWVVQLGGLSSRLTNATPGVFSVVAGVVLLLLSRPNVKIQK
jgi:hypothetical protein